MRYVSQCLRLNGLRPSLFVEPFAGGASVSLELLNLGCVEAVGLIERDPLVAAFWQVVFWDSDWLISQVSSIDVTVESWRRFKSSSPDTAREKALKCLYLNRTSFSGIIAPGAGPLGGYRQEGSYTVDCRFPRSRLISRIKQAQGLRDRVRFVWNESWARGLSRMRQMQARHHLSEDVFIYFDPPFFHKADRLYNFSFTDADHRRLAQAVLASDETWLVSYDWCDEVRELYGSVPRGPVHVDVLHSAAFGNHPAGEAIITNLARIPERKLIGEPCAAERGTQRARGVRKLPLADPLPEAG